MKDKADRRELWQILFDVILIGIFSIVKSVLMFYYSGAVYAVFGALELMVGCVLVINVYHLIKDNKPSAVGRDDDARKGQVLLYKQMKHLEEQMQELSAQMNQTAQNQIQEIKQNQLRSVKAVLNRMEEGVQTGDSAEVLKEILDKINELEQQMMLQEREVPAVDITEEVPAEEPEADIEVVERMDAEEDSTDTPLADLDISALGDDPNRELTPDEIAALFSSVN